MSSKITSTESVGLSYHSLEIHRKRYGRSDNVRNTSTLQYSIPGSIMIIKWKEEISKLICSGSS